MAKQKEDTVIIFGSISDEKPNPITPEEIFGIFVFVISLLIFDYAYFSIVLTFFGLGVFRFIYNNLKRFKILK